MPAGVLSWHQHQHIDLWLLHHRGDTDYLQASSHGESTSTLAFGSRVSEVTLGQAKKNSESAQIFEAKDQVIRYAEI